MSREHSATRSAAMTGAALATVALGSAAQVALYLGYFGVSHRTDGFIAAFAVYSLVVVIAQILRTTAVPLLSGSPARLEASSFGWAIVSLAVLAVVIGVLLAVPLGDVVASSTGPEGRQVATASLRVMAVAAGLQLVGAGLAVRGALSERLVTVAVAYMVSAIAGLAAFLPLRATAAERTLAWTTLVASVVLVASMLAGLGIPSLRRPRIRMLPTAALAVLRSIPVPASFVIMYPISLALAPQARAGDVTLFGLGLTACSYLAGFTGQGLSMVDAVALTRLHPSEVALRSALVARAFRYSLLVAAPGFAIAALVGSPVVHALIASDRSQPSFGKELLLLAPWTVATLGVWATLPAVLANVTPRTERVLLAGVVGLLAVHVAATLAARAVLGFDGVVVAMAFAPAVFVLVALARVVPSARTPMARDATVVIVAAVAAYGLVYVVCRTVIGTGVASGLTAAVGGSLVYVIVVARAFPEAAKTIMTLLPRMPSRAA